MTLARTRALAAGVAAAALIVPSVALVAPATAAPAAPSATSKQLSQCGFTKKPNVTAWSPGGTAAVSRTKAPQWADVVVSGKAPTGTPAGTVLTLTRYTVDAQCNGTPQSTGISTKVNKDGTFLLHLQLGRTGSYGYTVGYTTTGTSPEAVVVEFQLTTTKA